MAWIEIHRCAASTKSGRQCPLPASDSGFCNHRHVNFTAKDLDYENLGEFANLAPGIEAAYTRWLGRVNRASFLAQRSPLAASATVATAGAAEGDAASKGPKTSRASKPKQPISASSSSAATAKRPSDAATTASKAASAAIATTRSRPASARLASAPHGAATATSDKATAAPAATASLRTKKPVTEVGSSTTTSRPQSAPATKPIPAAAKPAWSFSRPGSAAAQRAQVQELMRQEATRRSVRKTWGAVRSEKQQGQQQQQQQEQLQAEQRKGRELQAPLSPASSQGGPALKQQPQEEQEEGEAVAEASPPAMTVWRSNAAYDGGYAEKEAQKRLQHSLHATMDHLQAVVAKASDKEAAGKLLADVELLLRQFEQSDPTIGNGLIMTSSFTPPTLPYLHAAQRPSPLQVDGGESACSSRVASVGPSPCEVITATALDSSTSVQSGVARRLEFGDSLPEADLAGSVAVAQVDVARAVAAKGDEGVVSRVVAAALAQAVTVADGQQGQGMEMHAVL